MWHHSNNTGLLRVVFSVFRSLVPGFGVRGFVSNNGWNKDCSRVVLFMSWIRRLTYQAGGRKACRNHFSSEPHFPDRVISKSLSFQYYFLQFQILEEKNIFKNLKFFENLIVFQNSLGNFNFFHKNFNLDL